MDRITSFSKNLYNYEKPEVSLFVRLRIGIIGEGNGFKWVILERKCEYFKRFWVLKDGFAMNFSRVIRVRPW